MAKTLKSDERQRIEELHQSKADTIVGCIPEEMMSAQNRKMFRQLILNNLTSAHLCGVNEGAKFVMNELQKPKT